MKKTQKKTETTKKSRAKRPPNPRPRPHPEHGNCRSSFILKDLLDDLHEPIEMPSIVLDLDRYEETMKELASLRHQAAARAKEAAARAIEARAAEHRYAVATAALEQANGQIVALKAAVSAFAHSTEALSVAVQPSKIDRWQPNEITKGRDSDAQSNDRIVMGGTPEADHIVREACGSRNGVLS